MSQADIAADASGGGETPVKAITRKRVILGLVIGTPISAFFLWLAVQGVNWSDVGSALLGANPWLLAAAVITLMTTYLVQAERWRIVARSEGNLRLGRAYSLILASLAVNNVVPGRAGEILRGWWLSRALRRPFSRCLSTVVVDRIADVGALVVALLISLPFVPTPSWLRGLLLVAIPAAAVLLGLIALAWWYTNRSKRGRRRAHLPAEKRSFIGRQVSGFVRGLAGTVSARQVPPIVFWSLLAWLLWAAAAGLVAASLGIALTPAELLFITGVINLGVAIPSTPGFVGTYQWLAVASLALFGIARADGFAFAVLLQAAWFVPVTIIGLVVIARGAASEFRRRPQTRNATSTPAKEVVDPHAGSCPERVP